MVTMAANRSTGKTASLVASKAKWRRVDETPCSTGSSKEGNCKEDSVQQWLLSSCQENVKFESEEVVKRHASAEDDLVLGVEASIYGKNSAHKTVQEFLRCQQAEPSLYRWNSVTSAQSGALSVMDVLNLWNDDPEELLLELGFGSEEPDISVKIPARFINHQSKAHGINIQVFLEAQKNRMDLENPDVSNRFRELEVLQQVTSAFSALVTGPPPAPPPGDRSEKRKRLSMLFRRASKKTLSMNQSEPAPSHSGSLSNEGPDVSGPLPSDRRSALKRCRPGLPESTGLMPVVEEQSPNASRDTCDPPAGPPPPPQEDSPRSQPGRDPPCVTPGAPLRRKSPGELRTPESFEIEEIHSFDEGSVAGSAAGPAESLDARLMRTNSCQSDSSGFLEEPVIPCLSQQTTPVPELMKALHAISKDSTDGQITGKENLDSPYSMDNQITVNENSDFTYNMDNQITIKENSDFPYRMNNQVTIKEISDFPSSTDSQITVKENSDLPFSKDNQFNVKDNSDNSYSTDDQIAIKENSDLPNSTDNHLPDSTDNHITVKENSDLPYSTDSQIAIKENSDVPNSTDNHLPYSTDSQITVKENPDFPYSIANQITVKDNSDISYSMDNQVTVKDNSYFPNSTDSQITEKENSDLPYSTDKQITVKENSDFPYRINNQVTIKEISDFLSSTDSQITVKENSDLPFSKDNQFNVKDNSDNSYSTDDQITTKENSDLPNSTDNHLPDSTDNHITVKENSDLPYSTDSQIAIKENSDVPNSTDNQITEKENSDLPYSTDKQITVKENSDYAYSTDNQVAVKENSDLPYRMDSLISVKDGSILPCCTHGQRSQTESLDPPCSSSEGPQGAPELPQTPCQTTDGTPETEGAETSRNPAVPLWDEEVGPLGDRGEGQDNSTAQGGAGNAETGEGAPTGEQELVTSLHTDGNDSLLPQEGAVTRTGGLEAPHGQWEDSETGRGWREDRLDADLLLGQGASEGSESEGCVEGADPFRPHWASFGSAKSVSVQMPSSLPSVSQTARQRRRPVAPLDLRREIADATAMMMSQGSGRGRRRSRTGSASLDTGLAREEKEEEGREEEVGRTEHRVQCCCVCDHRCTCCSKHTHTPAGEQHSTAMRILHHAASQSATFPYTLDELEGMMRCMRKFRCVLEEIEERLQEEQAQVYSVFSDLDREDMASIQVLRMAVKKEAEQLEMQLTDLAHHYDTGIKMKMHRLLDEQSHLCTQLRIRPFNTPHLGPTHSLQATTTGLAPALGPMSSRSVATQCCLLPDLLVNDATVPGAVLGRQRFSSPPGGVRTPVRVGTQLNPPD